MAPAPAAAALLIDASEWFHDPGLRQHVSVRHWRRLAARSGLAVRAALAACRERGVLATWFVTGDLAAREPGLLRELVDAGHEVALAGLAAAPLATLRADERERTQRAWSQALAAIETATGQAVRGFRAPWPTGDGEPWWRQWLRAAGLAYDASSAQPLGGALSLQSLVGDGLTSATVFTAWRLDDEQPQLVGLPAATFGRHYDQLRAARTAFDAWLDAGRANGAGPAARAFGLPPLPARPRPLPAPPVVIAGAAVPRLAIVVPLKDEAAGIASLAAELAEVARCLADVAACEFVLVDDGSTDATWALLHEHFAATRHVTLVQHERNLGVAAAIRTGLRATDAALAASIDGDLSYDPMELRAMLALLPTADVVTASPYHRRGGVKNVPGWRLLLSRTLSAVYRLLLWSPVRTWTSCFRVYRREVVVGLPLTYGGFLGTAEWLVRVLRRGGRVVEHPCVLEARLFGFSKMRIVRTILGHLRLLWLVLWRRVR